MSITDADKALLERSYDLLRAARMNAAYYENRLKTANRTHYFFEITIAVGTTGSIAAFAIWQTNGGKYVWAVVTGLATVLAVIKPILAPAKRLEHFTRQHQGWLALYYGVDKMLFTARQEGGLTRELRKRFDTLYDRAAQLHQEDEKCPDLKLLDKCFAVANKAHPPETLWMPSGEPETPNVVPIPPQQVVR